ncbi:MAG: ZIP family metal transporter [Armatimonadota bacterium]|nr:ZIP family metal transporter [Armatimonadota bacterium]MDR7495020.1 ZIP family metal transporter [Armatimonadota bacterium]MDR7500456.1 ZIP family metal transporter [Armatimonadota bacterium]MDR7546247.1 ZIP family metal transporter [Armatimonadota bacterium]MDR7559271.1 ZIP family metal transporter [Armatimonadota bacterium]
MLNLGLVTFFSALATAVATGIGGVPFLFTKGLPDRFLGLAWGFSGGMMLSASVFNLVFEGVNRDGYTPVAAGIALGAFLFWLTERRFGHTSFDFYHLHGAPARRVVLFIGTLTIHSFSEGIAVGVAFGSGEVALAALVTVAIAIHNIPEGLAASLPLRSQGFSGWACVWWSIFTSLPQPLMAVPAALAVAFFEPLVPLGLGFAAGAMGFLVFSEIIPEAEKHSGHGNGAAAVVAGFLVMMLMQNVLQ